MALSSSIRCRVRPQKGSAASSNDGYDDDDDDNKV